MLVNMLVLAVFLVLGTQAEPVRECLSEEVFQKATCHEIKRYMKGQWAEVRRLQLPFAMYGDDDCVVWDSVRDPNIPLVVDQDRIRSRTFRFNLTAQQDDQMGHNVTLIEGIQPVVMEVTQQKYRGEEVGCSVSMFLDIPRLAITKVVTDWWITFGVDYKVMVGYVCLPNTVQAQIERGLNFKNLLFIYVKVHENNRRMQRVKDSLKDIVNRLGQEMSGLEDETSDAWGELQESKCVGFD